MKIMKGVMSDMEIIGTIILAVGMILVAVWVVVTLEMNRLKRANDRLMEENKDIKDAYMAYRKHMDMRFDKNIDNVIQRTKQAIDRNNEVIAKVDKDRGEEQCYF
ncbi:hypothetical protein [Cellulosilyticum sp. I15G10I2]|uniref:hypothetical protein n=1 Tax=Cellulosilyticum sp. I15G10I2 TaxID=1892843 RepID=UPI00085C1C76|nr:hypothetical protein [Cellulosilyticum sp. I15G10I2]